MRTMPRLAGSAPASATDVGGRPGTPPQRGPGIDASADATPPRRRGGGALRGLMVGGLAVGLAVSAGLAVTARHAVAAETHTGCIVFDSNGNIVSLVPNCTMTIQQQGGQGFSFPAQDCSGNPGTLSVTISHQMYHITVNGKGDAWDTGVGNGTATFVAADPSVPGASGTFTNWFGDSFNAQNSVQHFTINISLTQADGVHATFHESGHVSFSAANSVTPVVAFDKQSLTCS